MNKHKNIESRLSKIPKKNPFDVPESYFETLQERIEAKIEGEENQLTRKQKVIRMLKPALAMAASFALVFLLVYYPLNIFLPDYLANKSTTAPEELKIASEEDLLFSYFSITEHSVYEMFSNENEQLNNKVTDEEMLDYLIVAMNETEIYSELKN